MNKNLIKVLARLALLEKLNVYGSVQINGHRYTVPIIGGVGMKNIQLTEPWMITLLQKLDISNGILDVGVNVGQTLLKFKSLYPNSTYTGFEPNPVCTMYSNELAHINNFKDVAIYPVGLSNESKFVKLNFFSRSKSDPSASIIERFRPDQKIYKSEYIRVMNFEAFNAELKLGKRDVVKIDVEGAELEVLEGLKQYLKVHKPKILIEILPVYDINNESRLKRQEKIEALVKDINYNIYRIDKENGQFKGLNQIDTIGIHGNLQMCDYVLSSSNPF